MDGVFRKESAQKLLSLFCVVEQAAQYVGLEDEAVVEHLLAELLSTPG